MRFAGREPCPMADADAIFRSLADSTRQRLLRVLSAQELSVSELVEILEQPQSTISRHLRVLREAGLLVDRRSANAVLYATPPSSPPGEQEVGNGRRVAGLPVLRERILDWLRSEELSPRLAQRIERVVRRRQRHRPDFFDDIGARWDQLRIEAFGEVFHLEALSTLLPTDWTVADIGTGTGYLLGILARQFARVIAVDPAEAMLAVARHRPEVRASDRVEFRRGSLEALPIEDGEVSLAIAALVLHHVATPPAAVAEIARCVRPGGRVLIVEQERHHHTTFHERMGDDWWGFEPDTVVGWLREAGLGEIRYQPLALAGPRGSSALEVPPLFVATGRKGG